ncbi:unnamed protein product [Jaminaea pallidilutea]
MGLPILPTRSRRGFMPRCCLAVLLLIALIALDAASVRAQTPPPFDSPTPPDQTSTSSGTLSGLSSSTGMQSLATTTSGTAALPSATMPYVVANGSGPVTPVPLNNSIAVRSTLSISNASDAPNFFFMALGSNQTNLPIYVALSVCSGPEYGIIPSIEANASDSDRKNRIESAQVRLYASNVASKSRPGPSDDERPDSDSGEGDMAYARGGFAQMTLNEDGDDQVEGLWLGIWPPQWNWDVQGTFTYQVVASVGTPVHTVETRYGITLEDTDSSQALITSFNYSAETSPNISLVVLPTFGSYALPSIYYNSSLCAIDDQWEAFSASAAAPSINSSETTRGTTRSETEDNRRLQFEISGLDPGTNYTAWLVNLNSTGRENNSDVLGVSLYPSIKLLTKTTEVCRLVYDVDFCPGVAYSIPIGPTLETPDALQIIRQTVDPNYANFSKTLSTFPCGDQYYGQYSSVRTCTDCQNSYQNWLCAVTMPRCTDPVSANLSAAVTDVRTMTGRTSPLNVETLPYIINRYGNTSRQNYFASELGVNQQYGELLPCLYTCLFVARSCPGPLFEWTCPQWDITAQHDYGTFADSGHKGLGAALNGGAGSRMDRWGGPLRYIAQDNFGNAYCSAMGVDALLRESNTGVGLTYRTVPLLALTGAVAALLALI